MAVHSEPRERVNSGFPAHTTARGSLHTHRVRRCGVRCDGTAVGGADLSGSISLLTTGLFPPWKNRQKWSRCGLTDLTLRSGLAGEHHKRSVEDRES